MILLPRTRPRLPPIAYPPHQTRRLRTWFHVARQPRRLRSQHPGQRRRLGLGLRIRLLCAISRPLQTMPFRTRLPQLAQACLRPVLVSSAPGPFSLPSLCRASGSQCIIFPPDPFVCSLPSPQSPGPLPTAPSFPTEQLLSSPWQHKPRLTPTSGAHWSACLSLSPLLPHQLGLGVPSSQEWKG